MRTAPTEVTIEAGHTAQNYWRDLFRYRELFYFLAWRNLLVRYKQTVIGILRAVLRPLLTMIVFKKSAHLPPAATVWRRRWCVNAKADDEVPKHLSPRAASTINTQSVKTIPESLLQEIVRRLVAGLRPKRIFLFGSHAYGTPSESSDIDLLVEIPASSEPRRRRASFAYGLLVGLAASTEILVLTSAEIEKSKQVRVSLENTVLRKGRLLYG